MDYDPIKDRIGSVSRRSPIARRLFYRTLDAVFLRAWYVHRVMRSVLSELTADRIDALDAGTGFAQYAYWILRTDERVQVTALDVKEDYLSDARLFFESMGMSERVSLREHDLTRPLPDLERFDLALAVDVLEHIEDDVAVLKNLAAALKPGGRLIVNTPSDQGGSDVDHHDGESFIGEHVRDGYSPHEMRTKMKHVGLNVEECYYTYGRPGSAAWRLLVRQPIRALNRSWLLAPLLLPYYAIAGPLGLALNALDLSRPHSTGTGLITVARKPEGVGD